jgi:hypothetical protein
VSCEGWASRGAAGGCGTDAMKSGRGVNKQS